MWTSRNRCRYERKGLRYPTDLTDAVWALVAPHIRAAKRGGRPRTTNMREVTNAILYLLGTRCQWRALPNLRRGSICRVFCCAMTGPRKSRKILLELPPSLCRVATKDDRGRQQRAPRQGGYAIHGRGGEMTGRSIDRRLSALERVGGVANQIVLVWCEHGQTKDEALASRFPQGVPDSVRPLVLSWMTPEMAAAGGLS
jgi:hypothetical protein